MKTKSKLFGLFLILSVLTLGSCSSDSPDNRKEYSFSGTCRLDVALNGFANQQTTSPEVTIPLDTLLKGNDYVAPITKGTMFVTNTTSIEINGLKEGVTLKNFTLRINDSEYKFGDVNTINKILYTDKTSNYFTDVFNRMISQKKLRATATFTPSEKIDETNNIKLKIVFGGTFFYWK